MLVIDMLVGLFVGTLLGLRFKVLVFRSAILTAACAIIVMGHRPRVIALPTLATVVLQIGYLFGVVIRAEGSPLCGQKILRHQLSKSKLAFKPTTVRTPFPGRKNLREKRTFALQRLSQASRVRVSSTNHCRAVLAARFLQLFCFGRR